MRFDDRLKTVMTQPVVDEHDRTVRWRQLVDLLSRAPGGQDEALLDAAYAMVEHEAPNVPEAARSATARTISNRPVDPRLVEIFARDSLAVAAPVLASARLDTIEWQRLMGRSSADVASFVRSLIGGVAPTADEPAVEPTSQPIVRAEEKADETPSIGEMVARIEQLRTRRVGPEESRVPEPKQPAAASVSTAPLEATAGPLFRWECDPGGEIGWVDGAPRGALIGRRLPDVAQENAMLATALADREPFDGALLRFEEPALEGSWRLSAIPAFSPRDGRFLGYRGIARRAEAEPAPLPAKRARRGANRDLEALRETIHEIKTPLNAIIGFAEIIDGQYLGPAHRNYRERAADIVGQARTLLAAIEDVDYAARLQARPDQQGAVARCDEVMPLILPAITERATERGVSLDVKGELDGRCALSVEFAERLLRRFLLATVESASPGEALSVEVSHRRKQCVVTINRPVATASADEQTLFDPSFTAVGAGSILGLGFALRLVRGLARLVDGDLEVAGDRFRLLVPAA